MFADTRDILGDEFQEYMHNTIKGKDVKNPWAPDYKEEEEKEESEEGEDKEEVSK